MGYSISQFELVSSKRCRLACMLIEDTDQTAHLRSLICVFNEHSMGSQEPRPWFKIFPFHRCLKNLGR